MFNTNSVNHYNAIAKSVWIASGRLLYPQIIMDTGPKNNIMYEMNKKATISDAGMNKN